MSGKQLEKLQIASTTSSSLKEAVLEIGFLERVGHSCTHATIRHSLIVRS